jgi:apolipoprotein N-acyltransferase
MATEILGKKMEARPDSRALQDSTEPVRCPMLRLLPALVSAGLLWLCYFPVAWNWLAWVALVPLLCLVRSEGRARNIYWSAWAAGLAFFWPVLQWMRVADYRMYATWAMLATYCALYFPAAIYLWRKLDRGTALPLVITVPVVWTALEFLRSFLLTGFAWYYLGHTQHDFLPLIQIADVAGAYGVTFLVAAANAWIFELLFHQEWFRQFFGLGFRFSVFGFQTEKASHTASSENRKPKTENPHSWLAFQGLVVFLGIVAALFYGFWRLDQEDFLPGPRVALLQGNLDQRIRNRADERDGGAARDTIADHYVILSKIALEQKPKPDLLVWPETSLPFRWIDVSPKLAPENTPENWIVAATEIQKYVGLMAANRKTNLLLGVNSKILNDKGEPDQFVSALLVTSDGNWEQRYDKIHRVPFGEYIPFKDWLPFMKIFAPYDNDYEIRKGEHLTRLKLGRHHFGVLICFEDTDPFMARQYSRQDADGPPVDFLLNTSNDGWFDGTSEHDEHLAICRFRAIECRRAVARSVNMGISAVIDSNGKVLAPRKFGDAGPLPNWVVVEQDGHIPELPTDRWQDFKKVAGVLTATIPIDSRTSLYSYLGDWLPWLCWVVIGGGIIFSIRRRIAAI